MIEILLLLALFVALVIAYRRSAASVLSPEGQQQEAALKAIAAEPEAPKRKRGRPRKTQTT